MCMHRTRTYTQPTQETSERDAESELVSESLDREIVEGYTLVPQTAADDAWARAAARDEIEDESW